MLDDMCIDLLMLLFICLLISYAAVHSAPGFVTLPSAKLILASRIYCRVPVYLLDACLFISLSRRGRGCLYIQVCNLVIIKTIEMKNNTEIVHWKNIYGACDYFIKYEIEKSIWPLYLLLTIGLGTIGSFLATLFTHYVFPKY